MRQSATTASPDLLTESVRRDRAVGTRSERTLVEERGEARRRARARRRSTSDGPRMTRVERLREGPAEELGRGRGASSRRRAAPRRSARGSPRAPPLPPGAWPLSTTSSLIRAPRGAGRVAAAPRRSPRPTVCSKISSSERPRSFKLLDVCIGNRVRPARGPSRGTARLLPVRAAAQPRPRAARRSRPSRPRTLRPQHDLERGAAPGRRAGSEKPAARSTRHAPRMFFSPWPASASPPSKPSPSSRDRRRSARRRAAAPIVTSHRVARGVLADVARGPPGRCGRSRSARRVPGGSSGSTSSSTSSAPSAVEELDVTPKRGVERCSAACGGEREDREARLLLRKDAASLRRGTVSSIGAPASSIRRVRRDGEQVLREPVVDLARDPCAFFGDRSPELGELDRTPRSDEEDDEREHAQEVALRDGGSSRAAAGTRGAAPRRA